VPNAGEPNQSQQLTCYEARYFDDGHTCGPQGRYLYVISAAENIRLDSGAYTARVRGYGEADGPTKSPCEPTAALSHSNSLPHNSANFVETIAPADD
jgi:hypothetical protein